MVEVPQPAVSQALKHRRAHFIKRVYETDPLLCPRCDRIMKIIGVIGRPAVACLLAGRCMDGRGRRVASGLFRLPPCPNSA
jgi:hypothetical protein